MHTRPTAASCILVLDFRLVFHVPEDSQCGTSLVGAKPTDSFGCQHHCGVPFAVDGSSRRSIHVCWKAGAQAAFSLGTLPACLFKFYLITLVWHATHTLVASKADNCVRENKNNTVLKHLAHLVSEGKADMSALLFSRVGHTHCALGVLAWD